MRTIQNLFLGAVIGLVVVAAACGKDQDSVNTTYLTGTWSNCASGSTTRSSYTFDGNAFESMSQTYAVANCTGAVSSSSTGRYDFTLGDEPVAVPSGRNIDVKLVNTTVCIGSLPCSVNTTGVGDKYIGVVKVDLERKTMNLNFNGTANAPDTLRPQHPGVTSYSKQQ